MSKGAFMFNQIKTKVSKVGKTEDYLNMPVIDRYSEDKSEERVIGVVIEAVEVGNYYELTIVLWLDRIELKREFFVGTGKSCSLAIS